MCSEFDDKLLDKQIPQPFRFVDPPRHWKAPIIVNAIEYLDWFEKMILRAKSLGYCISFVVGDPGSGKTHFISHINYRYYIQNKYDGIYHIYTAGEEKITVIKMWLDFYNNDDVYHRIKKIFFEKNPNSNKFSIGIYDKIKSYLDDKTVINQMEYPDIVNMSVNISKYFDEVGYHICIVVDNTDEYFRWLLASKERIQDDIGIEPTEEILNSLFSTLRNLSTNMQAFFILVSMTSPAYDIMNKVTTDRTYTGRLIFHDLRFLPLTLSQTFEMIHKYIAYWSNINDVEIPILDICIKRNGYEYNVYPFTIMSIEEIYESAEGRYARDIKMICSEVIIDMKFKGKIYLIEDEKISHAIETAHIQRPGIVPESKVDELNLRRIEWLGPKLELKINENLEYFKDKYRYIPKKKIIETIDKYLQILGYDVNTLDETSNIYNPSQFTDSKNYRLIRINKNDVLKNLIILYSIYDRSDKRKISLKELTDGASYRPIVNDAYFLIIKYKKELPKPETFRIFRRRYPILEVLTKYSTLDDKIHYCISAIEMSENKQEQKDLVDYVDSKFIKLNNIINELISKDIPEDKRNQQTWKSLRQMRER